MICFFRSFLEFPKFYITLGRHWGLCPSLGRNLHCVRRFACLSHNVLFIVFSPSLYFERSTSFYHGLRFTYVFFPPYSLVVIITLSRPLFPSFPPPLSNVLISVHWGKFPLDNHHINRPSRVIHQCLNKAKLHTQPIKVELEARQCAMYYYTGFLGSIKAKVEELEKVIERRVTIFSTNIDAELMPWILDTSLFQNSSH